MSDQPPDDPGGQGDDAPSRSELALVRQAVRNDWPTPPEVQGKVIQALVNLVDPSFVRENGKPTTARLQIAAARTLALFASVSLKQQALDLRRDQLTGDGLRRDDRPITDLVPEALDREREFDREQSGPTALPE